ncbi:sigma factor-like helix-turn-helix DNA-binding protein [Bacillus badius]|uniref:Prophage LambdaBa01, positive control factor Xpf n=1 Tax=Bacillus badius TaxID=1455 RepID=A0ABR5ANT4_BACBA|nr:sigma factor-like helix-turn-helix DNA-binding protein [Bacillus badius]KIL72699.1 prophage LambdaBa01, positive control factor Xpf [Bacillus badius]MED4715454.1 sigma factor-like helix-turn-helix DNA-binding protein [Bacillus badius]
MSDTNMRTLIFEYKQSLRALKEMKAAIEVKEELTELDLQDKTLINSMINEMEFVIQWMMSGRYPDARRGADRSGAYTLDPKLLEAVVPNRAVIEERKLTADEQWLLDDVLGDLTKRERDVFTLIRAEGLSYEYTAELLGISKSSVQTYLERAEHKIENRKNGSLFLVS